MTKNDKPQRPERMCYNIKKDSELYGTGIMHLFTRAAIAKDEEENEKYYCDHIIGGCIRVQSVETENYFLLNWNDVIDMAEQAGINKDPEELYEGPKQYKITLKPIEE